MSRDVQSSLPSNPNVLAEIMKSEPWRIQAAPLLGCPALAHLGGSPPRNAPQSTGTQCFRGCTVHVIVDSLLTEKPRPQ